ncbi:unnamed protein product [Ilex paraguariensis]|uniref:Uncharacterized protein n=1 Tax=Ilex paraguariensis TaxID=185542 RepID=A0ABC8TTC6_9AQUA
MSILFLGFADLGVSGREHTFLQLGNLIAALSLNGSTEDLVFRDVNRCSENLVAIFSAQQPGPSSYSNSISASEACSSSPRPCNASTSLGIHETRMSYLKRQLLAPVEHNAWVLKQYIEELYWGSGKRVMLLGHSKGGIDAAAALSLYWCDLEDKVAGLAVVQCPFGGTPVASDILREGQIADKETRRIMELIICKLIKGDMRALEDLTYEKRKKFIMTHKLPQNIPLISFHSEAGVAPGVIATLAHIAHAELPWFPFHSLGSEESEFVVQGGRRVPVVFPLSAAMAVCALHLRLRYGEKSDGMVTCRDAEVPGSVVVKPNWKLDHGWMVFSSWKNDQCENGACEISEALLTLLVELGKGRNGDIG